MTFNDLFGRIERLGNPILNAVVTPILRSPLARVLQPFIATISYTGRRSGNTFSTPVLYRRHGDAVTIWVASPESKTWWRNFSDAGAPLTIDLPHGTRTGHAFSRRDARGDVTVHATLDPPAPTDDID